MKKTVFIATLFAAILAGIVSCGQKSKTNAVDAAHNSRNSIDWAGSYTGVAPCADCEGINVKLTLNADETYEISYTYLGKGDSTPFTESGKFSWDADGGKITLDNTDYPPHYTVGENRLIQLDMEGNTITGEHAEMYVLTK